MRALAIEKNDKPLPTNAVCVSVVKVSLDKVCVKSPFLTVLRTTPACSIIEGVKVGSFTLTVLCTSGL